MTLIEAADNLTLHCIVLVYHITVLRLRLNIVRNSIIMNSVESFLTSVVNVT